MSDVNTLVGRGSHFEGKMTFEGVVRVDGTYTGEIVSDDTLIIGESAEVRAELDVATVVIYGVVYGNIRASNCVELHAPGRLIGNIVSPALVVERGATFDGNCRMGVADWQGGAAGVADGGRGREERLGYFVGEDEDGDL
ncbi:MAG: polymer-forming cytoskeletal protein [Myxococcales bacterium]|nr:polymer-forming cytoskeletal protein [Myxococcales bacterium]